jgi:hypothetical protein
VRATPERDEDAPSLRRDDAEPPVSEESRVALRRLREQLRDIVLLLEAGDPRTDPRRR